jgi:hypothetical protein
MINSRFQVRAEPVLGPRFRADPVARPGMTSQNAAYSKPAPRAHLYLAPSTSTGNSVE